MANDQKPWDARLAYQAVYPLRNTFIKPDYITTLRWVCGLLAFAFLSVGDYVYSNIGALFFILSNFLDHADGELARITGRSSKFGHYYDLASDALVNVLLFLGLGFGLMQSPHGMYAAIMGAMTGVFVAVIFYIRNETEKQFGKEKIRQANVGIMEAEDVLYLLPVVTFLQLDYYFLLLAVFGAPVFCIQVVKKFIRLKKGDQ